MQNNIEEQFEMLAENWRKETGFLSGGLEKNINYIKIIELGWPVVPLILKDLQNGPDHWGNALHSITGESPVTPEIYGNIKEIANRWIEWGKEKGFI